MRIKPVCGVKGSLVIFWLDAGIFAEVWPYDNNIRPVISWLTPARFMPYEKFVSANELPEGMIEAAEKVFNDNPQIDYVGSVQEFSTEQRKFFKEEAERTWKTTLEFDDASQP